MTATMAAPDAPTGHVDQAPDTAPVTPVTQAGHTRNPSDVVPVAPQFDVRRLCLVFDMTGHDGLAAEVAGQVRDNATGRAWGVAEVHALRAWVADTTPDAILYWADIARSGEWPTDTPRALRVDVSGRRRRRR